MPSVSQAQRRLFAAAAHNSQIPEAVKLRASLSLKQLADFERAIPNAPQHVKKPAKGAKYGA